MIYCRSLGYDCTSCNLIFHPNLVLAFFLCRFSGVLIIPAMKTEKSNFCVLRFWGSSLINTVHGLMSQAKKAELQSLWPRVVSLLFRQYSRDYSSTFVIFKDLVSVARFLLLVFSYGDLLLVVPDRYQL